MTVIEKLRRDWLDNHKAREGGVDGRPWGWQWGTDEICKQVGAIAGKYLETNRLLEIGFGAGKWTKWLFNYTPQVWAIDVHDEAMREAIEYEPRAEYRLCDGESLPFTSKSFGVVFSWDVFLHLPELLVAKYFMESRRVSNRLVFALPDINTPAGTHMFVEAVANGVYRNPYSYGFMTYYAQEQVLSMLRVCGWKTAIALGHVGVPEPRDMVYYAE